jgi:uncharacterized protein YneF (UPF0154 family)
MTLWLQWVLGCATCLILGALVGWFTVRNARRGDHG